MRISVVVPIYNVEKYLRKCVNSLLAQTYQDIQIILIDDGSTDSCPMICDDLKIKYDSIEVIHKENGGLSDARNAGIELATGDYILFVDSDDYIAKDTCEIFIERLNMCKDRDIDILVGNAKIIDDNESSNMSHSFYTVPGKTVSGECFLEQELKSKTMHMAACLNLYRREFLFANNLIFKYGRLHEDEEFTPRAFLKAKKVVSIDHIFYYYVLREGSITQKKDLSKNAFHLSQSLYELEHIYDALENHKLKQLLKDSLTDKYLNIFQVGKQSSDNFQMEIDHKFVKRNSTSIKNKLKTSLFITSKVAYFHFNKVEKEILAEVRETKKIFNNKLLAVILLLGCLFLPRILNFELGNDFLYLVYLWTSRVLSAGIMVVYLIKKKSLSSTIFSICLLYGAIFLINIFNNGDLRVVVSMSYPVIALCMLFELTMQKSVRLTTMIIAKIFSLLIVINFILLVINRNLFGPNRYLLGVSNQLGIVLIFTIFTTYVYGNKNKNYILFKFSLLIAILSIIISGSVNNGIAISLILGFLLLRNSKWGYRFNALSSLKIIASYIIYTIGLVLLRVQNLFSFFVEDILHKSLSLSGRTYIWDIAIKKIADNWLMGYGKFDNGNVFHVNFPMSNGKIKDAYWSAHNTFIQTWYESGIIPIIIFIGILYLLTSKIKKQKLSEMNLLFICLLSMLVILSMEAIGFDGCLLLLVFAYSYAVNIKMEKNL